MAEADAEDRHHAGKFPHGLRGDARLVRRAGAGRDDQAGRSRRGESPSTSMRSLRIDLRLVAELLDIAGDVEDEGIVVVDDEDHGAASAKRAGSNAWNMRSAFTSDSCIFLFRRRTAA